MGKKIHLLSQIDPATRTAKCAYCGDTTVRKKMFQTKQGWRCNNYRPPKGRLKGGRDRLHYRKYLGPKCERCGFMPEHTCQLDINHIDADRYNNDQNNLETLCANCHRIISYRGVHSSVRYGERKGTTRKPNPAWTGAPLPEERKQVSLNFDGQPLAG